jgi:hypothetical protein
VHTSGKGDHYGRLEQSQAQLQAAQPGETSAEVTTGVAALHDCTSRLLLGATSHNIIRSFLLSGFAVNRTFVGKTKTPAVDVLLWRGKQLPHLWPGGLRLRPHDSSADLVPANLLAPAAATPTLVHLAFSSADSVDIRLAEIREKQPPQIQAPK